MTFSSSELDAIVVGMILGDGNLSRPSGNANSHFTLAHSPKQREYLEYKKALLEKISHVRMKYKEIDFFNKQVGKTYKTLYYYSNCLEYFTKWFRKFYTPKKTVTRKLLDKLDPRGLALWWMDDGCLVVYSRKDRNSVNRYATLATCSFSKEEHEIIVEYFKETWGISPRVITRTARGRQYQVLKFPMLEFRKFVEIIKPHIIPSMAYKIDFKYVSQDENPGRESGASEIFRR